MFLDASSVVAIFAREVERETFSDKINSASIVLLSPITLYEAVLALSRVTQASVAEARAILGVFVQDIGAQLVAIDKKVGDAALDAFERFGKGRHRAALNMGDCFSYACAKIHGVPLLFKGDDFVHTDVRAA